ncbi:tyrosine-type recombinase/integrase [Paraburkholderia phenoliruptrix]|uniref:Tyrosine-type recombinase/integrase n=1 Tax=Paraburkholderia phenoliruptrix TaxID=252970 RepID=A0ABV3WG49_9BURK
MASITLQPNGKWRAQVYVKGERDTQVFRTQREAKAWGAAREDELRKRSTLAPADAHTLREVLNRYLEDVTAKKEGSRHESMRIKSFLRDFPELADLTLANVKTPELAKWRDARLKTVTSSTVNRDINWLRHALSIARDEWHWMTHNPFAGFRFPNDPPPRDRRVTPAEVKAFCRKCGYVSGRPPATKTQEVAHAFLIALRTSMRAGEIVSLGKDNVDLKKRTATLEHKMQYLTGKPRVVPMTRHAVRLLKPLMVRERFFTVTAASLDTLFRKERDRLAVGMPSIATLHFHDTRAEALTRLSRKVDVMTLAKISGHKDLKILQETYYRESAEDIAARI